MFDLFVAGFTALLSWKALFAMVCGVSLGIVFGALPGLSATTGMALLLPVTYSVDVSTALLLMGGIFAGALYGGSMSAVLLGIPGTAAALPTTFDGFPMCRQGRGSEALLAGLYGSSIGGIASALVLLFLTPLIASVAIKFGTAEMFLLGVWGLSMVTSVLGGDIVKGLFMGVIGLLLGLVGPDPVFGIGRLTFGQISLFGGFPIVPVILGCLALPRAYEMIENFHHEGAFFVPQKLNTKYLKIKEIVTHRVLILRSLIIGVVVGIAPAAGPAIAAMISYNMAVKNSKHPETFGKGNVEGVWASETANNACTGGDLVLTLALGIPGSAAAAVLMSTLTIKGIQPGPLLMTSSSELVYTFFAGFLVVNFLIFFIGHGFIHVGKYVLKTPVQLLAPAIILVCVIGAYSDSYTVGLLQTFVISIITYFLGKLKFSMAPLLLGLILVDMMEKNFWSYYSISQGNLLSAFQRPMFLGLLALVAISFAAPPIISYYRNKTGKTKLEDYDD